MRSIEIIFVVVLTVVLSSLPIVHSQEGALGAAFGSTPAQSPIQAEDLPMDSDSEYREEDTEDDQKY